ncbi:MAG: hypothetical protein QOH07_2785, partial [Mycobacterium sp.]|nr:hypothetical protein [Mycobacterium sp.]
GHHDEYGCAGVAAFDAQVVQAAAVSQGELPKGSTVSWRMRKWHGEWVAEDNIDPGTRRASTRF